MAGAISSLAMAGPPDHGIPDIREAQEVNQAEDHIIRIELTDKSVHNIRIPFKPQEIRHTKDGALISGEKDGIFHDMLPLKLKPGERLIGIEPAAKATSVSPSSIPSPVAIPAD